MQITANKSIRGRIKQMREFQCMIDKKVRRIIRNMDTCHMKYKQDDFEYIPTALKAIAKECDNLKECAERLLIQMDEAMEKNHKKLRRWRANEVN